MYMYSPNTSLMMKKRFYFFYLAALSKPNKKALRDSG